VAAQNIYAVAKNMLTLTYCELRSTGYLARIQGPKGTIELRDLVWIVDRDDLLEIYYWQAWAVLQGAYHCCLSIPGRVLLIK
jgi:hypothetical protein